MHQERINLATVFSSYKKLNEIHNTQTTQSMHIPVQCLLYVYSMQILIAENMVEICKIYLEIYSMQLIA